MVNCRSAVFEFHPSVSREGFNFQCVTFSGGIEIEIAGCQLGHVRITVLNSHINKHLQRSESCKNLCSRDYFSTLSSRPLASN